MKFCRKTMWLMVAAAALLPTGCASQRGRMASKREINTAQLLAAARQYEKEGQIDSAANIYRQVLTYHPGNSEAKEGLALVQQGKLRVNYDTGQLLASTDPSVQKNPQARQQLAKKRHAQREQIDERMAQLIAQAAQNPKSISVDPTPTPTMVASATAPASPADAAAPAPAVSRRRRPDAATLAVVEPRATTKTTSPSTGDVAQANGVAPDLPLAAIETTAFSKTNPDAANGTTPSDGTSDSEWTAHSLTSKCADANAAVLTEIEKLEEAADDVRKEGLTNLAKLGTEAQSAAPAIRRLLHDHNQLVAAHAAWALWETDRDSAAAVDTLLELLDSPSSDVVQFATYTLGRIGKEAHAANARLSTLLDHADQLTKLHAAEAITLIAAGDDQAAAADTLLILLTDEDADIRSLAAMTLGQVSEAEADMAVAVLTVALDDTDASVRSAAALSLGALGQKALPAVAKLEETSQTDDAEVREAVETALACIKL